MTRPAGKTPRGFPYPGSDGTHAQTPAYIQALATVISQQLLAMGKDNVLAGVSVNVRMGGGDIGQVTVPTLRAVAGYVACPGSYLAGATPGVLAAPVAESAPPGVWVAGGPTATVPAKITIYGIPLWWGNIAQPPGSLSGKTISMDVLAWGLALNP